MRLSDLLAQGLFFATALAAPASLDTRATGRTSAPSGCLIVRSGTKTSGEYATLSSAVAKASSKGCIFIFQGTYSEQVTIPTTLSGLKIYGYTTDTSSYKSNTVTITYSKSSAAAGNLDKSSTLNVLAADFGLYNVNVANTYGKVGTQSQAVALTGNGDRQGYYGVSLKSYQDTLYAKAGYQYYSNSYIEGAVDYIFGNAAAWFNNCVVASVAAGYVTANSRETSSDTNWYVFDKSTIQAASGASVTGKVYLGRPWRVLARVIYQNSVLTDVVQAEGWTTMAEGATPVFMEYKNTGAGSSTSKRKYLTTSSAAVTKAQLWPKGSSWPDTAY